VLVKAEWKRGDAPDALRLYLATGSQTLRDIKVMELQRNSAHCVAVMSFVKIDYMIETHFLETIEEIAAGGS
jgi:hypothetical protein